jgi:LPS-assembly lipoprotein
MWWFKAAAILALVGFLGACGFRPLYGPPEGPDGAAAPELASIDIKPIPDRVGQELHNHLLDLLTPRGRPENPTIELRVQLRESKELLAVAKSSFATRANLRMRAVFFLHNAGDADALFRGDAHVVSSYNVFEQDFATLMAEKDARSRAARELAQVIRTRLAVYFDQRRQAQRTP